MGLQGNICAALLAVVALFHSARAYGQAVWVMGQPVQPIAASDKDESKRPFHLVSQSTENTEALQDFDRHKQRGTWERAIKALEKARAADANALVPRDDDFYIPSRVYLRHLLASLPQDGKDAYRLFQDPEAKKLLEQAQGQDEAEQLTKIVEQYFIASITDVASDRLGDLEFERGDVEQAAERWQSILRYRPESALSQPQLLVKTGIALVRAGRWDECRGIVKQLRERYPEAMVRLAGREVNGLAHLSAILATRPATATSQIQATQSDIEFAAEAEPLWQFQFAPSATDKNQANANFNAMMNGRTLVTGVVPKVVIDEARAYVNFIGISFAIDLTSGKLLWRSGKLHDITQKMQNVYRLLPEQNGICLCGDHVFLVSRPIDKLVNQNQPFVLSSREVATGKEVWTSDKVADLKDWQMWGEPTAAGDRVYMTAYQAKKNRDLHVLAIQAVDGKLLWSTHIGTYQVDEGQLNNERASQPSLVLDGERLYIETHVGTVILVDSRTGSTLWGFNYEAKPANTDRFFWYYEPRPLLTAGPPLIAGETLYVKGMRSTRLCAVQLFGPSVVFKRPINKAAILIGSDDDRIYLGGDELAAIDLKTQKLAWATRVPIASEFTRPIMTRNRLYQFTPRGIFEVDKATGDVVKRFRGADLGSRGGILLRGNHTLLSVSNLSLTAYALPPDESAPPQAAEKVAGP